MRINLYYHKSSSSRAYVKDYINSLDRKTQYEIFSFLQKFKNDYRFRQSPYCKKIVKDIFEIRIKAKDCYRILYAFLYKDTVVLLHIFKKKTNKIPKKDLELAINRFKLYEQ